MALHGWISKRLCSLAAAKSKEVNLTNEKHPLVDKFNRFHTYLRISLTERCNLRCQYCMPEEGIVLQANEKLLSASEIQRIARLFVLNGVDKIRLTGGEPTIRKDLVDIVAGLRSFPQVKEIGMTTNGIALSRKLDTLVEAGLNKLNVSLDTLNEAKYMMITRRNGFSKVMRLIDQAEPKFERLKLNCVVIRGINDDEVVDFVKLTRSRNLDIRFIEYMPFGGNNFNTKKMVPFKEILSKISQAFDDQILRLSDKPNDTSKAYKVSGFKGQFGFITSMSEHFCATCNRLRITADGNLKVCLHGNAEVSLRDQIRANATDEQLLEVIAKAVGRKKAQHADRYGSFESTSKSTNDFNWRMSVPTLNQLMISKTLSKQQIRLFSTKSNKNLLTHTDSKGKISMVDVSEKVESTRIAMAKSTVKVSEEILQQILSNSLKKGDVGSISKISGLLAAKQTSNLIPLCHNIPISSVDVKLFVEKESSLIHIFCRVKTKAMTGVEMESLVGVSLAALTLYDMCKSVGHSIIIQNTNLIGKKGGKRDFGIVDLKEIIDESYVEL